MSVNSYLTALSGKAIIRDLEKVSIQRSISTLQTRLQNYYGQNVKRHFIFGSYSRGTILPRHMDSRSDIDYMIVFNDASYRPQTYLDNLRRFVTRYYSRSEIKQSSPTIILSLNHIRFELVPAIETWISDLQIPAKTSSYSTWIDTDPIGFNQTLSNTNGSNKNLIKPLVRLVKYWNAKNGYVYESYELEQKIVEKSYFLLSAFGSTQLKDYLFDFMESLNVGWLDSQRRIDKVQRAKRIIAEAKKNDRNGVILLAERQIKRFLPPTSV